MLISVAICTWNRSTLLDQTLAGMETLRIPSGIEWELLVVNNNCTDETDEVIARYAPRFPIRRLFEARQGLSNARNCAVAAAKGDLILWTDDDVLVDCDWILGYVSAATDWPNASVFGGPVVPWFEGSPPQWLLRGLPCVFGPYAIVNLGAHPVPLSYAHIPFGANYAVRTGDQARYPYDPALGHNKTSLVAGEETTVIRRMLADGLEGWWVPRARVLHHIPKDRQTIRYLRRYFAAQGVLSARWDEEKEIGKLFGKPRWVWRKVVEAEVSYRWHRLIREPEVWIKDLEASSFHWGYLREYASHSPD